MEPKISLAILLMILLPKGIEIYCSMVQRLTYGKEIDLNRGNLFASQDYFENSKRDWKHCNKNNSSCAAERCIDKSCCMCKCYDNTSFLSFENGCLDVKSLNEKSGQNCRFQFPHVQNDVVPAFVNNHNDLITVGVALDIAPAENDFYNHETTCLAGKVYEIHSSGRAISVDQNDNYSFFEIQDDFGPFVATRNLKLNDRTYSRWQKLEGKLIRLDINCFLESRKFRLSSCLLFKVNGTSNEAEPTIPTAKYTTNPTKVKSIAVTATKIATVENNTNNTRIYHSGKGSSVSAAAIAGAVVGVILLVIVVILIWFWLRKRKNRSNSKRDGNSLNNEDNEYTNDIPLVQCSPSQKELEHQESMNPYYKTVSESSPSNHYYSPGEVLQGVPSSNQDNVYYSSADVVDHTKENGKEQKPFEYSYARGESATGQNDKQGQPRGEYAALDGSEYQPGLYQALGSETKKDDSADDQDAQNPYYKPARVEETSLVDRPAREAAAARNQSLKNHAGSREDVSPSTEKHCDGNENHYQGLTIPGKNNVYQSVAQQEEYLDMSVGSASDGEYMYADPNIGKL